MRGISDWATTLGALRTRLSRRVSRAFTLGITARLSISLIAVAVMAAFANIVAQQSASLVRIHTLSTSTAPPATASRVVASPLPMERRSGEALQVAIERFGRAGEVRAASASTATQAELSAAGESLERSLALYLDQSPLAPRSARTLTERLRSYGEGGLALVRAADQRRLAGLQHGLHLAAMNERMQVAIDHAWHLFGRIFARQSLMQLHSDLEAIRQRSALLAAEGRNASLDDAELIAGENTLESDLRTRQGSLEGSQGASWVRDMQADCAAMLAVRGNLAASNGEYARSAVAFSASRAALLKELASAAAASRNIQNARARAAAHAPLRPLQSLVPVLSGSAKAPMEEAILTRTNERARDLMAAVTVMVLIVISVISVFTVRSVLVPVRRILQATAKLAAGDIGARVALGGISELDSLASAFNGMAERLEAAREISRNQHASLEAKVLERTHKLQRLAQQDPLTSLPNRRHLQGLLNDSIELAAREARSLGVYFLDVDNFKNFNDSLGHEFGDRVLMSVANRLEEIVAGTGFVARLGGDEFTVVYEDARSVQAIEDMGARLVRAFHELLAVDDRELSVSVSVGASIFPQHARDAEGLLRAADTALFRAKELGRSQVAMFSAELTATASNRFTTEQGLRRAVERGEFELLYQPEIDLSTLEMGLVEALLRWRMPDGRLARPAEFLAVAEQSGLIGEMNNWVLRTAVESVSRWHHGAWPQARVAVNISPRQLLDHRFIERLLALLQEFRVPRHCIELELTESVLQTGATTIAALGILQSHGIGIALDDFGTGYSSLTSLEQLPLSRIKLDRSLIATIDTSPRAAAIAKAIIDLCEGLGLAVTAEGIERPAQFGRLLGYRAMYLQGYLLSDAVHREEVLVVRDSIGKKMQDLLLSASPKPAHALPTRIAARGIFNR